MRKIKKELEEREYYTPRENISVLNSIALISARCYILQYCVGVTD